MPVIRPSHTALLHQMSNVAELAHRKLTELLLFHVVHRGIRNCFPCRQSQLFKCKKKNAMEFSAKMFSVFLHDAAHSKYTPPVSREVIQLCRLEGMNVDEYSMKI